MKFDWLGPEEYWKFWIHQSHLVWPTGPVLSIIVTPVVLYFEGARTIYG